MIRKLGKIGKMIRGIDQINHSSVCVVKEAVKQLFPNIGFKLSSNDEEIILVFDDKTTVIYNCITKSVVERMLYRDIIAAEKAKNKAKNK